MVFFTAMAKFKAFPVVDFKPFNQFCKIILIKRALLVFKNN